MLGKFIFPLLFLTATLSIFSDSQAQSEKRLLRVGVYQNAPQVFINEDGDAEGIYVDILSEIARLEDWQLEFVESSFSDGLESVRSGQIDILTSIASTPEREKFIDFSKETIISIWGQLYVHPKFSPQNILDLNEKKIAVMKSGLLGDRFKTLCKNFDVGCRIIPMSSYDDALQAIDDGKVDAAVVNSILGFSREAFYQSKRSSIVFSPFRLQVAVPEGMNSDITAIIDQYISQWRADKNSFYFQTLDRWLGVKPSETTAIPTWMYWVSAGGIASILIFIFWNMTLRSQITQRKKAEKELEKAKVEAETANAAKSEFLAAMSHDLRTPLNAIMGFSDVMRQATFGRLENPQYEEYVDDIHNSGALLVNLINDILDLSKIEAGKYDLSDDPLDVGALIEVSFRQLKKMAEIANQTIVVNVQENMPHLLGDERALIQILNNLLSNAIKFSPNSGQIKIIAQLNESNSVLLSVEDTGIGMSQEGIGKALKPFEQADGIHSRRHEGTGLGLHLCFNFMKLFGGTLEIKSKLEQGTTVTLSFPSERTIPTARQA
ncbi:MAG: transporter substrate-binding domain-containing protein [Rhodospirillales bacterium]|nr:transporter substrate-binding domain-containing protein [Rhodospirillales bacterium]